MLQTIYVVAADNFNLLFIKKSESLQTEGRHFRSTFCKLSDFNCSLLSMVVLFYPDISNFTF